MAYIPPPLYLAAASQLGPVIAALRPYGFVGPRRWVVAWCSLAVAVDLVSLVLARHGVNNHWTTYVALPLRGLLVLLALAGWQRLDLARHTLLAAIPVYVAMCAVLFVVVERADTYSAISEPVYTLLGMVGALFTLLTRSMEESRPLVRQEWFWICGGLLLFFGSNAAYHPFARIALSTRPDLVLSALVVRSLAEIVAFAAITIGVLCPTSSPSGASTSPASSAWRSSSSRSVSPS